MQDLTPAFIMTPAFISSQYKYDGLGRRIQKVVTPTGGPTTTTRYLYDQEDILLEYDGTNVLKARWMQGPGIDDPLMMERDLNNNGTFEAGERFVYHTDGLGSITELTDSTGATVRSYLYDAFGQLTSQTGTLLNPYGFTAREHDSETGLSYYRWRTLNSQSGRFLQEDPILRPIFMNGVRVFLYPNLLLLPMSLNPYPYGLNNPVNLTDSSGLQPSVPAPSAPPSAPSVRPPGSIPGVCPTDGEGEEEYCPFLMYNSLTNLCVYQCPSGVVVQRAPEVPGDGRTCPKYILRRKY